MAAPCCRPDFLIKTSLLANQEREAKLNRLGDALKVMEQHVEFVVLADAVDEAAPRPRRERGGRPHSRLN